MFHQVLLLPLFKYSHINAQPLLFEKGTDLWAHWISHHVPP